MPYNVTAIYRCFETADTVRRKLMDLGMSTTDIHMIPDNDEPVDVTGERSDQRYMDALHDLGLPEGDLKTYQRNVRRGDFVVSVEVSEDRRSAARDVMRRPDAETSEIARWADVFGRADGLGRSAGERDPTVSDPYLGQDRRACAMTLRPPV